MNTLAFNSVGKDADAVNVAKVQDMTPPSQDAPVMVAKMLDDDGVKIDIQDAPVMTPPSENALKSTVDKALSGIESETKQTPPSDAPVTLVKQAGFGMLLCEHCGKEVQRRVWNQRFCCDDCRTSFHGFGFKGVKPKNKKIKK